MGAPFIVCSNLKSTTLKFSSLEGKINRLVFMIFLLNLVVLLISAILSGNWQATQGICSSTECYAWYIDWDASGPNVRTARIFF